MSSSGGFYKYRCKHFWTHKVNCTNWLYVNNSCCAECLVSPPSLLFHPPPLLEHIYSPVVFVTARNEVVRTA